ncbi:hypothetical protein CI105_09295 [Candidatus Izimaplasma bacterium ZiA1]|uniref:hypothetical protein n=1 Tax=Candidatus Izimoplasma sp. ZiA1 TaxID=2024899 RepID=UPI000BAA529F|nr:hypothetical protein CI105_09295 [Candidatus Izimaplasma bacterium ZiA1]
MAGHPVFVRTARKSRKTTKASKPIFRKMNASSLIAKKRRSNLIKTIKDINISMAERKYLSKNLASGTGVMNHNQIYQFHCWGPTGNTLNALPSTGNTDSTRIGDRIYLEGFMLRASLAVAGDRRNTKVAVYFVPHNSEQGDPSSDLFHNVTGSTQVDPLQKKRYPKAKLLGVFRVEPSNQWYLGSNATVAENTGTMSINRFIPVKKKVFFIADASIKPSNLQEYGTICFCPYQNWKTLSTDNLITGGDINITAYFKDI